MRRSTRGIGPAAWAGLLALCVMSASLQGAEGTGVKVKVARVPLASPQAVLCMPDSAVIALRSDGTILGGRFLSIDSNTEQLEYPLGGSDLIFSVTKNGRLTLSHSGGPSELVGEGMSLRPVMVKVADGRSYTLAFPYGFIYPSGLRVLTRSTGQGGRPREIRAVFMPRSGQVLQFTLDGQRFCIFDANTDGFYRLADDAISSADPKGAYSVFAPLRKVLATRSGVYRIVRLAEDGSELEYVRAEGPAGRLAVVVEGSDLEMQAAFVSKDAEASVVASVNSSAPTDLGAASGRYDLLYGLVYSPKLKKLVASVRGGKLEAAEVGGRKRTMSVGGPFALELKIVTSGGQMTIHSRDFRLSGKNGEEYANFTWAAEPEINLRAGGRTERLGKMEFG